MAQQTRRVLWPRLAGVVLIIDGILCVLAAALYWVFSMFIGAVEGRESTEEPWLLGAGIAIVLAVAGFWSGQRAIRAIRRGRLVGVAVAGVIAAVAGYYLLTGDPGSVESTIAWSIFAGVHALAAVVLLAWPAVPEDRTLPAAVGAGRA